MDRRVGRTADGGVHADGVEERLAGQDVGGFAVGLHHFDDLRTSAVGAFLPVAVRCGNRRRAGQRHAQGLGQRVHRRRSAHRVAKTRRRG